MPSFIHKALVTAHTMGADVSTESVDIDLFPYWSMQFNWTGTPTGNVSVQVSNDGSTWFDVTNSVTATGGAAGSLFIDFTAATAAKYIRGHYAYSSGSGSLTITVNIKSGA